MNRFAVVLAADSATTVTQWVSGNKEERYFKGANKIFQLSDHHPVGVMIYDSAEILRVPWEVAIKEFRRALGSKSFNTLEEYASEFFGFLNSNLLLFPEALQKAALINGAEQAALDALSPLSAFHIPDGDADTVKAISEYVAKRVQTVEALPLPSCVSKDIEDLALASVIGDVAKELAGWSQYYTLPSDLDSLARLGVLLALRDLSKFIGRTGIVFAGFGDHEVFPAMLSIDAYGIVFNKFLYRAVTTEKISHDVVSNIEGFAQNSMTDTFVSGLGFDLYSRLMETLEKELGAFTAAVCEKFKSPQEEESLKAEAVAVKTRVSDALFATAREEHAMPLRRVLGVLPVDEMAELAETLIRLQSLKEKVTKPSETVGGPVDVAVITKNEGLVWIKRKHFFQHELNPRYMMRQSALYR